MQRKQLSRKDWLELAMELIVREGVGAVSIQRLARELDITRGSFYHHFADREDLLVSVLEYWESEWTIKVRDEVAVLDLDPFNALLVLAKTIRNRGAAEYDAAFRAWAQHDPIALAVLKRTDGTRLDYVRSLFRKLGFRGAELESRSRLFLYYETCEPSFFAAQTARMSTALVESRLRLLTQPVEETATA